jgi:hypothetical protein
VADWHNEVMMLTTNPFVTLADLVSPLALRIYLLLMLLAVLLGTLYDLLHGLKARFYLLQRQRSRAAATRRLSAGELAGIAVRTIVSDIATFGEFGNRRRRLSHILMFYGFMLYLFTTVILVVGYPTDIDTPDVLPILWHLGVLMTLLGGYWFFFFLRVNVSHDGQPSWRLVRADLFIGSLLLSVTSALLMRVVALAGNSTANWCCAGAFFLSTTLLFVSIPWSKFAHMFYKPVMAFQKRLDEANGASDLPRPANLPKDWN